MPTVGRTLATERARQGLDLEDAAAVTKISTRALKFIENDDFEQLPGMIFARNFVRQYAQFLKLDSEALVEQFNREQAVPEQQHSAVVEEKRIHVPRMPGPSMSMLLDSNIVSAFITLLLTIAVCVGALYAFQYWRSHRPARVITATAPAVEKPESRARAVAAASPAPPPAPATGVHVLVTAREDCWARITVDGKVLFADILKAGEKRDLNGMSLVNIRAGNAGGLAINLNGKDVPPLGPEGQVRTASLTRAGVQLITPTPEVSEPR
jgi:cytoskeletal protein RodZ